MACSKKCVNYKCKEAIDDEDKMYINMKINDIKKELLTSRHGVSMDIYKYINPDIDSSNYVTSQRNYLKEQLKDYDVHMTVVVNNSYSLMVRRKK